MIKIGMIGIAAVFLALLLKKEKGELALLVGIAASVLIFGYIFIFLHIVTHADLQLFLFDCGRKYKIILQSAGIKINISTGLISISLFKKYLDHVNKFRNAMGCRFYHIRFFDI